MRLKVHNQVAALVSSLLLMGGVGCGGGDVPFGNPTHIDGVLDQSDYRFSDGSRTDYYIAKARRDGRAIIEMQSPNFDSYLIISARNSEDEVENIIEDDNSGGGKNARVTFDVKKNKTYFIAALDDSGLDDPGPYTVTFSEILKDVRENPAATAEPQPLSRQ